MLAAMTTEMNETDERAKRKAGTPGVAAAAAAAGAAAGMVAGSVASALLGDQSQDGAAAAPAARDPFDDLVPPPAAPAAAATPTTEAPAEAEAPAVSAPPAPPVVEPTPAPVAETVPTASAAADVVTEPVHVAPAAPVANEPAPEPVAAEPPAAPPVVPAPPAEPVAAQPVTEPPVTEQPVAVDPPVADPTNVEPPAVDEPVITEPVVLDPTVMTNDPAAGLDNDLHLQPIVNLDPAGTDTLPTDQPTVDITITQPMPTPTDPQSAVPPQGGMEAGGGLDPITGLAPGAGMPPVANGPIDDPFATPMPPDPGFEAPAPFDAPTDGFDGGGVPGPERPVMPAEPVALDPIAPVPEMPVTPEPIIVDVQVQSAAMDAIGQFGKYVQGFSKLPIQSIDNEDKMELWHAIRQLDPTLTGGPLKLQEFVQDNATLGEIADHYNVNVAQLATMVQIEDDAKQTTIATMMNGSLSPNMTITPGLLSFDVDGQAFQITSNGELLMENNDGQEATFQSLDLATVWIDAPPEDNWGWLFFSNTSTNAQVLPTLDD